MTIDDLQQQASDIVERLLCLESSPEIASKQIAMLAIQFAREELQAATTQMFATPTEGSADDRANHK